MKTNSWRSNTGFLKREKIIPTLLVVVYFLLLIIPPSVFSFELRWYLVFGLGVGIFILNQKPLQPERHSVFLFFIASNFFGYLLSLFRTSNYESHMYLFVGSTVGMLSNFMMLSVLSQKLTRKWLWMAIILAAILWVWHVRVEMTTLDYLTSAYYLAGEGNDKNYIALILSMALVSVISLLVLSDWGNQKLKYRISRLFLFALAAVFLYTIFFTYSRSGLIALWGGILVVFVLSAIKKGRGIRSVLMIMLIGLGIYLLAPSVLNMAPQWQGYFNTERLGNRLPLLQKALTIIADNPFIGVGLDATKDAYITEAASFSRGLPHNLYLKTWAELGIFGLLGYVVWIIHFIKLFKAKIWLMDDVDRAWMIMIFLVLIMMFFLDMGSLSLFTLAVYSGLASNYSSKEVISNAASRVLLPHPRRF